MAPRSKESVWRGYLKRIVNIKRVDHELKDWWAPLTIGSHYCSSSEMRGCVCSDHSMNSGTSHAKQVHAVQHIHSHQGLNMAMKISSCSSGEAWEAWSLFDSELTCNSFIQLNSRPQHLTTEDRNHSPDTLSKLYITMLGCYQSRKGCRGRNICLKATTHPHAYTLTRYRQNTVVIAGVSWLSSPGALHNAEVGKDKLSVVMSGSFTRGCMRG